MISSEQRTDKDGNDHVEEIVAQQSKRCMSPQWARTTCFVLIVIMNLSAWIDLLGVFVELPLIMPQTPEGWTLPSAVSLCIGAANIAPALLVLIHWRQKKRFSEIPYIYIIIIVGIISCCVLAISWQRTVFVFGRDRSVWLLGSVFTLSILDNTSSLVFFDYMKRFRPRYLTAVFLGEGLTGFIPTLLALSQGVGGEAICTLDSNGTVMEPTYTQPRFSVSIFMFLVAGIIILSLIAFLLLRCTSIISLADAAEPVRHQSSMPPIDIDRSENLLMVSITEQQTPKKSIPQMTRKLLIALLVLNALNSIILFGCLPSLVTYSLLPYGQKAFYYASLLNPMAYTFALLLSVRWTTVSTLTTFIGSLFGFCLCIFIIIIAWQSPCPWWADTIHGALIMIAIWFLATLVIAYVRIGIGNRIKIECSDDKGMFYFGITVQFGLLVGTIPTYILINVYHFFTEREPCRTYCLT